MLIQKGTRERTVRYAAFRSTRQPNLEMRPLAPVECCSPELTLSTVVPGCPQLSPVVHWQCKPHARRLHCIDRGGAVSRLCIKIRRRSRKVPPEWSKRSFPFWPLFQRFAGALEGVKDRVAKGLTFHAAHHFHFRCRSLTGSDCDSSGKMPQHYYQAFSGRCRATKQTFFLRQIQDFGLWRTRFPCASTVDPTRMESVG
jgi:hypothetical protein